MYNAAAYKAYTASNYREVQKLHWGKISGPIFFALFGYDVWVWVGCWVVSGVRRQEIGIVVSSRGGEDKEGWVN